MTTIAPPINFAQTQGDLGQDFIFAAGAILLEVQDRLDLLGLGTVPLVGDLMGTGSDTIRVREMGTVGWSQRMAALATEDAAITASSITTGYTEVTVGMYGLAHEETYQSQILSSEPGISLEALEAQVPNSWLATHRYLVCVEGATFGTIIGSATAALSVDDWLDLVAATEEMLGVAAPMATLAPQQMTQLRDSARTEPAFQNLAADFAATQRFDGMQIKRNVLGLGLDAAVTDDVVQSGGAYQGFAHSPGGIGWARASTSPIRTPNPSIYVPELGMFIERIGLGSNGKARYEARAWIGVNSGSANVFLQRRIRSVV